MMLKYEEALHLDRQYEKLKQNKWLKVIFRVSIKISFYLILYYLLCVQNGL